ncbi:VOC family protein [Kitasatospora sp. NPDC002551]|uniref:VOC family protein n=1 Tax=unclassified Kitasatospora TaxID=2633591 RepID=UPI00332C6074
MAIRTEALLHVAVVTRDVERLSAFYQEVLGAQLLKRLELRSPRFAAGVGVPGAEAVTVHLRVPGADTVVELTEYRRGEDGTPKAPANAEGWRHIAFRVPDLAAAAEELRRLGLPIEGEGPVVVDLPVEAAGTGFLYFRDPDGNIIELIEPPGPGTSRTPPPPHAEGVHA